MTAPPAVVLQPGAATAGRARATAGFDLVVPTVGRESLARLLAALAAATGPLPGRVLLVDDRRDRSAPLLRQRPPERLAGRLRVLAGPPGRGPAAARNLGWRAAVAPWVAFLDDDVVPAPTWLADLEADLADLPAEVAGSQGRLSVPLPAGRRPTDWERNVHGLETARWATADMAYRRAVLAAVGGFDERFPRAYREDADLALRVVGAGYRIERGRRAVTHPVRPAGGLVSVRLQAGNADDVLMGALHGRGWREMAGVPRGRRGRHLAITAAGVVAVALLLFARRGGPPGGLRLPPTTPVGRTKTPRRASTPGQPGSLRFPATTPVGWIERARRGGRPGWRGLALGTSVGRAKVSRRASEVGRSGRGVRWLRRVAGVAGLGWWVGTVELAWARIVPGPRTPGEVAAMAVTSVLIPPAATWHWLVGWWRLRGVLGDTARAPRPGPARPAAVLFDRDGTLVADVPYNGDPGRVVPMPGAREALARLRAAGVATAVVSNQSGVARGRLRPEQVEAVNRRVEELLGPLGPWLVCPHGPADGCRCRKPAPGLIEAAASALGVEPRDCVVIGDIGADVEAAKAAGARAVLVPTPVTRPEEVADAPEVAPDLPAAVALILGPDGAVEALAGDRRAG
jgi:histidinol-phosphate phosphatase family protein